MVLPVAKLMKKKEFFVAVVREGQKQGRRQRMGRPEFARAEQRRRRREKEEGVVRLEGVEGDVEREEREGSRRRSLAGGRLAQSVCFVRVTHSAPGVTARHKDSRRHDVRAEFCSKLVLKLKVG